MVNKIGVTIIAVFFLFGVAFAETEEEDYSDEVSQLMQEMQRERRGRPEAAEAPEQYPQQDFGTPGNMSPEDAIVFYEQVLMEDPHNYVALTALGDLYANIRVDIHKSIKFYERAIQANDKYDLAHLGLGFDYVGLKMYDDARREFQRAIMVSKRTYVQETARQALMNLGQ
jgi:tetratricopeptide (TPR) repeat protein